MTKKDWIDWKVLEVSKQMLQGIYEKRELLKEGLANGQAYNKETFDQTVGRCIALQEVIDLWVHGPEFSDLDEEDS